MVERAYEPIAPLLASFLTCAKDNLSEPVGLAVIMPGSALVIDDCCSGELWVRLVSIVGVSNLSQPSSQPCLPMYQLRVAIGVARCIHTVDDNGVPPSAAQMTADAFQAFQDRADILRAITCCIAPIVNDRSDMGTLRIEDWLPGVAEGGCVYGEQMFTLNMVLCGPCIEEETP